MHLSCSSSISNSRGTINNSSSSRAQQMKTVAASEMVLAAAAAAVREKQLQERTEHQEQIIKLQAQLILEQQQVQHTATTATH